MKIDASRFRDRALEMIERAERTRELDVVTRRGRPVAILSPASPRASKGVFGYLAGTVLHEADIVHPVDERWESERT